MTRDSAIQMPRFFWFSEAAFAGERLWARVLRKARRIYFSIFHPSYVRQSIATSREGECHRCGACCALVFKCPFLGYDASKLPYCRIYGDLRPTSCMNYPFDRIDSEVEQCGFRFK